MSCKYCEEYWTRSLFDQIFCLRIEQSARANQQSWKVNNIVEHEANEVMIAQIYQTANEYAEQVLKWALGV